MLVILCSMVYDIRKEFVQIALPAVLFVGAMCGLDYLAKDYRTHLQRMENEPAYKVQVMAEKEQNRLDAEKELVNFCDAYARKYRIPFLEDLFE